MMTDGLLHIDAASVGDRSANEVLLAAIANDRIDAGVFPDGTALCGDTGGGVVAHLAYAAQIEIDNVCSDCRYEAAPQGMTFGRPYWGWLSVDAPDELRLYTPPGYPS